MMQELQYDQAVALLKQRAEAQDELVTFARVIDIPAVPIEASDEIWDVVETPLATHHLLTLHALQAMSCGRLLYDPDSLKPVTIPTPDGLALMGGGGNPVTADPETARGGRADGGVGHIEVHDPSRNPTKTEQYGTISPTNGNIEGDRPCDTVQSSLPTKRVHRRSGEGESRTHSGDLTRGRLQRETDTERNEFSSQNSREVIPSLLTETPPEGSGGRRVTSSNLSASEDSTLIFGDIPDFYLRDRRYHVCRRVMIMEPPGSAKSTYGSVVFPVWDMGRNPDHEIILTGWGDPICRRHGKRARKICESDIYRGVMSTGIDPQTRAAEDWALMNGSTYKSSGINSGVAGFRCDGLVWDDLTKNRKEADSETIRNDIYNAYIDDARSRKKPDAWEVGIGTRWHEDEIMGRILPEGYSGESGYMLCRDGNVWLVICLAAECERDDDPLGREIGEMIWPEWFGEDYWAEKRVNPRSWGSLYQQRPAPEEGIMFKREDFRYYDSLPQGDNWMCIDPAVSEEDDADDTAILIWRVDEFARMYLIERIILHVTMDKWVAALLNKAIRYKPMEIVGESGVIRRSAEPWLKRAMIKLKSFFAFEWVHRHANKPAMARGAQAMVAAGQVFVPRNSDGEDFIDSCLRFPASKQDHDVDAFVNLCLRLEFIWEANVPKTVEEKPTILTDGGISIKSLMPPRFPKRKSRWKRAYKT